MLLSRMVMKNPIAYEGIVPARKMRPVGSVNRRVTVKRTERTHHKTRQVDQTNA